MYKYNGLDYLSFKRFLEKLIKENRITEFDTVYDLMNQAELYDNENMVTGNDLSSKNIVEYDGDSFK